MTDDSVMTSENHNVAMASRCWCGRDLSLRFGPDYFLCEGCQTLVSRSPPPQSSTSVIDDQQDFYGVNYWTTHQIDSTRVHDVDLRSRSDLADRCVFWLERLLQLKLPPAKVLEIGSGNGAFVHLMRLAGFDASGSDLSPWVCGFASRTFEVPIACGPVEGLKIDPGSLDVIVLMDVIEHVPDPLSMLRKCNELLKPDGIILIQTPCFDDSTSFEDMCEAKAKFLVHLHREHLQLFSRSSVQLLCQRAGLQNIESTPALFDFYDQFLAAGRSAIRKIEVEIRDRFLVQTPETRTVLAMLDLHLRLKQLIQKHRTLLGSKVA